jgi:hypothetical protein
MESQRALIFVQVVSVRWWTTERGFAVTVSTCAGGRLTGDPFLLSAASSRVVFVGLHCGCCYGWECECQRR